MWDVPWLDDLRVVPEDASWPRYMSAPHPNAVGSLGVEFEDWIGTNMRITLRWWQRLSARRLLEIDSDGALCWSTYLQSVPRRGGKSVLLRALAYWRLHRAVGFGEPQLVMLTGKDLPICKEIHRKAWPIAASAGYDIRKQNGNEEIEHPDGSRWLVRGKDSVYGYDVCLGMVDEAWGVAPSVVDDGLEPALLERVQPQLVMTSTAHPKATTLMPGRMDAAMAQMYEPEDVLLMVWAADPNALPADRVAWREASPHWSRERERMLERTLQRLIDGTEDAAGIADPAESFKAQYLNVWPVRRARQNEWLAPEHLQACSVAPRGPVGLPVAALEVSVDGSQWSAAASDGQYAEVYVSRSLEDCLHWLATVSPMEVLVHAAVESRLPSNLSLPTRRVTVGEAVAAAGALHQAVTQREVQFGASDQAALMRQFSNVVTSAGPGGMRIGDRVSRGPVEAVKCLSWANWRAVTNPPIPAAIY